MFSSPVLSPNSCTFWNGGKNSADRISPPPGNSVCTREHIFYRGSYTAACRSRPGRTPIPAAIFCFGSSFLPFWCTSAEEIPFRLLGALLPGGGSLGGGIALFALNFIIGGVIGGFVLAWRLIVAVWYVPLTVYRLIVG